MCVFSKHGVLDMIWYNVARELKRTTVHSARRGDCNLIRNARKMTKTVDSAFVSRLARISKFNHLA